MNDQARRNHWEVVKEDWLSHGYTDPRRDEPLGVRLENNIHSMFSYWLDDYPFGADTKARWGKLTMTEYGLLDQPLRLATRFLMSAPSKDAICSILHGERYISPDNLTHKGIPVYEFRKHKVPPSVAHVMVRIALEKLGKFIMFRITDRDEFTDLESGSFGKTHRVSVHYPEGVAITEDPTRKGLSSIICISRLYMKTLMEWFESGNLERFPRQKLNFELAISICHEVVHAINYAVDSDLLKGFLDMGPVFQGVPFNEPIHEGQPVAELGWFWENHVFGGACNHSLPIRGDPVFFSDWPSWMFRDKDAHPERGPPRKMSIKWLVPAYYIQNTQNQEFWDALDLWFWRDVLALRIRKRVGVKCYLPDTYHDYDKTWDEKAPGNWLQHKENHFRVEWDEADPSGGAKLANETRVEREGLVLGSPVSTLRLDLK